MKKVFLLFLLLITTCSMFAACIDNRSRVSLAVDEAPAQYESEEEFISAIKDGVESNGWDIENITYYYRPKNPPEGAILKYVEVMDKYVKFVYTLDTDKQSRDYTKMMTFMWYREYYKDNSFNHNIVRGWKEQQLEGTLKGTTYIAEKSFSEGKASMDNKINIAWSVSWVQDGEYFGGSVPYSIPESDIAKYLEMEKVVIE